MLAGSKGQTRGLQRLGRVLGDIIFIVPGAFTFSREIESCWVDVLGIINEDRGGLCRESGTYRVQTTISEIFPYLNTSIIEHTIQLILTVQFGSHHRTHPGRVQTSKGLTRGGHGEGSHDDNDKSR